MDEYAIWDAGFLRVTYPWPVLKTVFQSRPRLQRHHRRLVDDEQR